MFVRQYVYFALFSRQMSAAEMTARLMINPDETTARGSRHTKPAVVPVQHSWDVACREAHLRVEEQIECVLARLRPSKGRVVELATELAAEEDGHGGAVLNIVRHFDAEQDDDGLSMAELEQKQQSGHHLLGWTLEREAIEFLAAVGAKVGVDEYG